MYISLYKILYNYEEKQYCNIFIKIPEKHQEFLQLLGLTPEQIVRLGSGRAGNKNNVRLIRHRVDCEIL